jgi:ABC-type uncharacterized transport system substrate-binding protein
MTGHPIKSGLLAAWLAGCLVAAGVDPARAADKRCLFVSSFHAGQEWNDLVEKGLDEALAGRCQVTKFYMDTQRSAGDAAAAAKGAEAKALIDQLGFDVVIACDDGASKFLVMPHLRDAAVPVVFCGVNGTVEPYGYPYANTTGIIETSPIPPLLDEVRAALGAVHRAVFLAADAAAQRRELVQFQKASAEQGVIIDIALVNTMLDWEQAYVAAQRNEFVILGDATGIRGWNEARAAKLVHRRGKKLSVTIHPAMSRLAVLTMTKMPEEHGAWAGEAAVAILQGKPPAEIPIVASRRWRAYVNDPLRAMIDAQLSETVVRDAIRTD